MKQRLLRTALMLVLIFCSSAAWAEKQMYSKLTGSTLTVYYDENKTETDYSWPVAFATRGNFTNVIFDNSFAEARPTSTTGWFWNFENLQSIENIANLNTSNVTDMSNMFFGCASLTSLDVSHFDTSNVTYMGGMFETCQYLTNLDVSHFDTGNVTNMAGMFGYCASLNNLDVSHINTSNVTDMGGMFNFCASLTSLDVSNFNTSNVTDMSNMFGACASLTSLDVSNFNTSNVTNMKYMFSNCQSLTKLNLLNFDFSSVTDITWMFGENYKLETIYCTADLSGVESGVQAFIHCKMLEGGNGTSYSHQKMFQQYARPDREGQPGYFTEDINHVRKYKYARLTGGGSNKTLTFYYDLNKTDDDYIVADDELDQDKRWSDEAINITHVIFDGSFAEAKPSTTASWFGDFENLQAIDGITNLNTCGVTSMYRMFAGCSSLASLDVSHFNTSNVTYLESMFSNCSSLTSLDVSNFDTGNVTNMVAMFQNLSSLASLDVSHFDTSNVTDMAWMFDGCSALTSLDVSNFNTSNVTDMHEMFYECSSLTSLDVSNFNNNNVTRMSSMFRECRSLTSLNLSNFNTSNVTDMSAMFSSCSSLTSLDLSNFNTSKVTTMEWMFSSCSSLTSLDVSNFNTSNVTEMGYMFYSCSSLTSLDLSNFNTSNVTSMGFMFRQCSSLKRLDLSNFNTSIVTNMGNMFEECSSLRTINVGDKWSTSNVTNGNNMFVGCKKLVGCKGTAYSLSHRGFDYAHIDGGESDPGYLSNPGYVRIDMYARLSGTTLMFYYDENMMGGDYLVSERGWSESASTITNVVFDNSFTEARPTSTASWFDGFENLQSIEGIANLNTSNVTDMNCMFRGCTALASLNVSNFDTGNVTNMVAMFQNLSSLASLDVSHFDTSNVTDMAWMFDGCSALTSLDLSNFNTSKVTDMGIMFHGCIALASLDLRHFDTSNVTTMAWMFDGCSSLGTILVSDKWSIANVTEAYNMFYGCENLVGCRGTTYSSSHIEYDYAHIDEGESNPGYLSIELILLTAEDVTFGSGDLTYNGSAQMPEVTVTHGGSALTVGTDYSLTVQQKQANDSYADVENAINIGSYKLIVTGIGAYLGTFFKDFTISAKALTDDMVTLSAESFDFNGEAQKPTVTVKDGENTLEEGTDYDLTNEGGINPGTYSAKVDGKGNYCGEVTKTYVIVAETVEEGDVKGAVIDEENKEVILTDIDVEPGATAVTIPTTIGDYTVVAIAANTLAGMTDVTDINLPETEEPLGLGTNALRIDDTHVATVHTPLALLDDYALNTQLQQNFEAGKVTAVVTAPNKYWTFSCGVDVLLPDGVGVYTCQLNSTKTAIEITQIDDLQLMVDGKKVIKANNGVLVACIDGTGGNAYDIVANPGGQESGTEPATTDAKSYGLDNQLEPVIKSANYAAGNYYVLVDNEFHPIIDNSSEVPACKAVLKLPTMVAASRGLIIVGNNDGTTGISGVSMEAVKSDWFDLNGHRIERPTTKGVFINNGKIVIIK